MTKEREQLLEDFIEQAKIAVPWMVKTFVHAPDELNGNYSDELKHAIALRELVEVL